MNLRHQEVAQERFILFCDFSLKQNLTRYFFKSVHPIEKKSISMKLDRFEIWYSDART